jgi:hypothetical protein
MDGIKFHAIIPLVENALRIDGGEGARLILDIPESQIEATEYIRQLRGKQLVVTISIHGEENGLVDTRDDFTSKPIWYG